MLQVYNRLVNESSNGSPNYVKIESIINNINSSYKTLSINLSVNDKSDLIKKIKDHINSIISTDIREHIYHLFLVNHQINFNM